MSLSSAAGLVGLLLRTLHLSNSSLNLVASGSNVCDGERSKRERERGVRRERGYVCVSKKGGEEKLQRVREGKREREGEGERKRERERGEEGGGRERHIC